MGLPHLGWIFDKMKGQAVYEAGDTAVRQETETVSNGSRWNANWFKLSRIPVQNSIVAKQHPLVLKCCQHSRYADKDDCIVTKAAAQLMKLPD